MESAGGLGESRMTAVEICRKMAREIWLGDRKVSGFRVQGLNTTGAVRERLRAIAGQIPKEPGLNRRLALFLASVDWEREASELILKKTEEMLDRTVGGSYRSIDGLLSSSGHNAEMGLGLMVVQSLAGRLGLWAVRSEERPDAEVAKRLSWGLGAPDWGRYNALNQQAQSLAESLNFQEAARCLMDADRLVRTPAGLIQASACLCQVRDYPGALWAIRAALLEPEKSFESDRSIEKARELHDRLIPMVDSLEPSSEAATIDQEPTPEVPRSPEVLVAPVGLEDEAEDEDDWEETTSEHELLEVHGAMRTLSKTPPPVSAASLSAPAPGAPGLGALNARLKETPEAPVVRLEEIESSAEIRLESIDIEAVEAVDEDEILVAEYLPPSQNTPRGATRSERSRLSVRPQRPIVDSVTEPHVETLRQDLAAAFSVEIDEPMDSRAFDELEEDIDVEDLTAPAEEPQVRVEAVPDSQMAPEEPAHLELSVDLEIAEPAASEVPHISPVNDALAVVQPSAPSDALGRNSDAEISDVVGFETAGGDVVGTYEALQETLDHEPSWISASDLQDESADIEEHPDSSEELDPFGSAQIEPEPIAAEPLAGPVEVQSEVPVVVPVEALVEPAKPEVESVVRESPSLSVVGAPERELAQPRGRFALKRAHVKDRWSYERTPRGALSLVGTGVSPVEVELPARAVKIDAPEPEMNAQAITPDEELEFVSDVISLSSQIESAELPQRTPTRPPTHEHQRLLEGERETPSRIPGRPSASRRRRKRRRRAESERGDGGRLVNPLGAELTAMPTRRSSARSPLDVLEGSYEAMLRSKVDLPVKPVLPGAPAAESQELQAKAVEVEDDSPTDMMKARELQESLEDIKARKKRGGSSGQVQFGEVHQPKTPPPVPKRNRVEAVVVPSEPMLMTGSDAQKSVVLDKEPVEVRTNLSLGTESSPPLKPNPKLDAKASKPRVPSVFEALLSEAKAEDVTEREKSDSGPMRAAEQTPAQPVPKAKMDEVPAEPNDRNERDERAIARVSLKKRTYEPTQQVRPRGVGQAN